jgi:hypothetical protein
MRLLAPSLSLLLLGLLPFVVAPRARACAGGLVTVEGASITSASQLALLSHRAATDTTDVVVRVNVPAAEQPFGVLIPVPASQPPTVDPAAIPAAAFDALDVATRPQLFVGGGGLEEESGFFGCGGVSRSLGGDGDNEARGVIFESPAVNVGPVVAQYIVATDTLALSTWLSDNGYALPDGGDDIVASYVAAGAGFLAFKRADADNTPSTSPVSVGVHFTVPGDLRTVPLRMVQLGAPDVLPVTFFVATAGPVGPAAPWRGVLVEDVDAAAFDYAAALDAEAAQAPGGQVFVFETATNLADVAEVALEPIRAFLDDDAVLSRLSARLPREALASDVAFTGPRPSSRSSASAAAVCLPRQADLALVVLGVGLLAVRRRRR